MLDKYDPFFHLITCGMYLFYIHLILALEFEKKMEKQENSMYFSMYAESYTYPYDSPD